MKTILWDFDGVILDSMKVRTQGFRDIFDIHDKEKVERLVTFHLENGGLSRYVKIRFFFESILRTKIDEIEVKKYADQFSRIMRDNLISKKYLIKDTLKFIQANYTHYNFHIVSGSDQLELRYLCSELGIASYFKSIFGSPTPKSKLVEAVILANDYSKNQICLIGDSKNDYEAAIDNEVHFFGFNNKTLMSLGSYIDNFDKFKF